MMTGLKFAVVAATLLGPFAYVHSASARTFLSYQEAVWMCGTGDLEACDAMHAYETAPPGARRGPMTTEEVTR